MEPGSLDFTDPTTAVLHPLEMIRERIFIEFVQVRSLAAFITNLEVLRAFTYRLRVESKTSTFVRVC